jgi:hypothetical protein
MVGQDMVTASPGLQAGVDERSAVGEIRAWGKRYVRSHPLQSLETVGGLHLSCCLLGLCTGPRLPGHIPSTELPHTP